MINPENTKEPQKDVDYALLGHASLAEIIKHPLGDNQADNNDLIDKPNRINTIADIGGYALCSELDQSQEDGEWLTANAIREVVGKSKDWVKGQLVEFSDHAETRLSIKNREWRYYPPFVLKTLKDRADKLKKIPEQADYYNVSSLVKILGKHISWVNRNLEQIKAQPHYRIDKAKRVGKHYSSAVLEKLKAKLAEERAYPEAGGFITRSELTIRLKMTNYMVRKYLKKIDITPWQRRAKNGKILPHYPEKIIDLISALHERQKNFKKQ